MKFTLPKLLKKKMRGTCRVCGAKVSCLKSEAKLLVDRDSPDGAYHVKCVCGDEYLWVS